MTRKTSSLRLERPRQQALDRRVDRASAARIAATAFDTGISTFCEAASSISTGAVNSPSASLPAGGCSPRPSAMPSAKLRDCGLEQVRIRSPRPDRPASVSPRAPQARPRRANSVKPRVVSAACAEAPSLPPDRRCRPRSPARSWPRRRSRRRGHLSCDRAGRSPSPAPAPARSPAPRPSPPASPRSAGRAPRRRRSSGPTGSPAAHRGAASAMTSVMNLCVPCSMPLAQATTGIAASRCGASAVDRGAQMLRGRRDQHHVGARGAASSLVTTISASSRTPGSRGLSRVEAICAARSRVARLERASRPARAATRPAPCPMRRRRSPRRN